MTIIKYREVSLTGKKIVSCDGGCGKSLKRSKRFYQTLNPFNKLPNGDIKTPEDIYPELKATIQKWKNHPETCSFCLEIRRGPVPAMVGDEELRELLEHYFRVLHITRPGTSKSSDALFARETAEFPDLVCKVDTDWGWDLLIYDVGERSFLCPAREFFETKKIEAFTWKG
jgi:hypothetical protein